ncbi:UPF0481 protein At3g47200-like [Momordica charantia]|uniref:UPF0481 protein At3g47200-like n=1 Tax=Momordica charantia TaxID=3673 RepID=A0A6J1BQ17_MOMCH|nr:UPF0481 protein At3g47200-like [Momordica charantia]
MESRSHYLRGTLENIPEARGVRRKLNHVEISISEECSIYRISKLLHNINDKAYTPQAISIGPFHHGRQELMAMERLKLTFLDCYLSQVGMEFDAAFEIARGWEARARQCYAEPINMNSADFVKLLLVDAAFLVMIVDVVESGTALFKAIRIDIYRDLILLENQLPFFILVSLFEKCTNSIPFVVFARNFCRWYMGARELIPDGLLARKPNHLVDFLSFYYALPIATENNDHHKNENKKLVNPPTATELWEAGVRFQKAAEDKLIMDIHFQEEEGVLAIPHLEIHDAFETYMRNLLAYEHYHVGDDERCIIQYILFLDDLISTERDVSLLVKAGIITNGIGGNDEEVSKMFNNLCKDVSVYCDFYYYNQISMTLRKYCETPWHRWRASLKRDYFNSPWTSISFLAATVAILLTVVQTVYSVISK